MAVDDFSKHQRGVIDRENYEAWFTEMQLIEDGVLVLWEYIDEGADGDWDPENPDDTPLLRFSVHQPDPEELVDPGWPWVQVDDGSWCTNMPVDTDTMLLGRALHYILSQVGDAVRAGESIDRVSQELSWLGPDSKVLDEMIRVADVDAAKRRDRPSSLSDS